MVTNAAKTKCRLVTRKRLANKIVDGSLTLPEQVESQKLLRLTIDPYLNFNVHFEELRKKLS